jgi:hypothetical protein
MPCVAGKEPEGVDIWTVWIATLVNGHAQSKSLIEVNMSCKFRLWNDTDLTS